MFLSSEGGLHWFFAQGDLKPKEFVFANRNLLYASDQKFKHVNLIEIITCSKLLKALNSDDVVWDLYKQNFSSIFLGKMREKINL